MSETPDQPTPRRDLPAALRHLDEIGYRLSGCRVAVFLDYDGTLTPIVEHPDLAVLDDGMRATIRRLAAAVPVVVLSGRDTADVRSKVAVAGILYAGSHGFDITDHAGEPLPGVDSARFQSYLAPLGAAADEVEGLIRVVAGAHVERKRFAVAIHYRQADRADVPRVREAVAEVAPLHPELRVTDGKEILEFRPDLEWDKGRALRRLLQAMDLDRPDVVPLYLGDDTTDEDGFREIRDDGIGIVVGRTGSPSLATYSLEDTDEARVFLEQITMLALEP